MADFLLEIGLEEVPARMIAGAEAEACKRTVGLLGRERLIDLTGSNVWTDDGLHVDGKQVAKSYSTPRRLAIHVTGLVPKQDDLNELIEGPPVTAAYKNGEPTAAAHAFAKKVGVPVEELLRIQKAKGEYVCARILRRGRTAVEILAAELPKEVLSLYWAKNMYWRAGKPERFVRPVRWLVALLDSAVVPLEIAGIAAGNASRGHRVLHGEEPVIVDSAKSYSEELRKAFVMVDVAERRHSIRKALDAATRTVTGARWREDVALIETVVHLTEWPSVVLGDFEPEYLKLPEEVLVTVMRDHQKYFAIEGADGKLAPHFLAVLNTQVDEKGQAIICHGNARVLRARFKDAQFFWDFDQKTPLTDRVESLKNVTFQKELGSYFDKSVRLKLLVDELGDVAFERGCKLNKESAFNAAVLAKTDLTCELVKEFTELQGIIGALYSEAQGYPAAVAQAIYYQYQPESMEDAIPPTGESQLLAIADKADSITGMFGIGLQPTGSKDPFALRRAANGIVKILAEGELPLDLPTLLNLAADQFRSEIYPSWNRPRKQLLSELRSFFIERLQFYLRDAKGHAYDVVSAVLAAGAYDVRDAIARAEALSAARKSEDFAAISAAFKRIKNILRQAEDKKFAIGSAKDVMLSEEAQRLSDAVAKLTPKVAALREERSYGEALALIATLRPSVDAFFDKVMVLDPDPDLRGAHLGLIDEVLRRFSGIADFSEIVTA